VPSPDNSTVLRRYIEEIDPKGEIDALPAYVQADVVLPEDTTPHGRQGLEGLREHLLFVHESVRYTSTVEDMVADEDKVAARVSIRGKLVGEFMGLPPTDKEFAIEEFMIAQFRDGKISHVWRVVDLASLMQQLSERAD
jgi:predicted ester cyclase